MGVGGVALEEAWFLRRGRGFEGRPERRGSWIRSKPRILQSFETQSKHKICDVLKSIYFFVDANSSGSNRLIAFMLNKTTILRPY
jgi:hypothetical protein